MIRIIIGGDICPMGVVEKSFINGDVKEIYHDLLDEIKAADWSIANLECPLIEEQTPTKKAGPVLGASTKCAKGIKAGGWKAMNLANNHSFDHGAQGLSATMGALEKEGIPYFGAGRNLHEAQKPFTTAINGQVVVFYSMAEQEFSVATNDTPGSNPLDMINFVYAIKSYKSNNPFIVLLHGGVEHFSYPSPEMMRRCRFMIDMGADAVICSHSHCPQPWETYKGKPIVYGLGNLVFEPLKPQADIWHKGYLAELLIEKEVIRFRPIPYFQSLNGTGAIKMAGSDLDEFMKIMGDRCSQIIQVNFIENEWGKYCKQREMDYLLDLYGYRWIMRKFSGIVMPILHPLAVILHSLLIIRCESHREVLDTILRLKCKE